MKANIHPLSAALAILTLALSAAANAQTASFNPTTNTLTIPTVTVGTTLYGNAQIALPPGGNWTLLGISPAITPPSNTGTCATPLAETRFPLRTTITNFTGLCPGTFISLANGQLWRADNTSSAVCIKPSELPQAQQSSPSITIHKGTADNTYSRMCDALPYSRVVAPVEQENESVPTSAPLAIAPETMTGTIGQTLGFAITGGNPPYRIISTDSALVTITYLQQNGNQPSATGNFAVGNSVAASATIIATDCDGVASKLVFTKGTTGGSPAAAPLTVTPASGIIGYYNQSFTLVIAGGTPPYNAYTTDKKIAQIEGISQNGTSPTATVSVRIKSPAGSTTIVIVDNAGIVKEVSATGRP